MTRISETKWFSKRLTVLLCILPATALIGPLLGDSTAERLIFDVSLIFILLFGIHAVDLKTGERKAAWTLVIVSMLLRASSYLIDDARLHLTSDVITALFFAFVTAELFLYVVRAHRVDTDLLSAGLCVYLLIGMTFALFYSSLDRIAPRSFAMPPDMVDSAGPQSVARTPEYVYYSFISMTTTGFGDIRPVSRLARSLTIIEICVGQIYLVVMIARLVGIWSENRARES